MHLDPRIPNPEQPHLTVTVSATTGTIESALAKISDAGKRADAAIEWQDASAYERDHPLIAQVGDACGLTSEQIDDLFRAAAKR